MAMNMEIVRKEMIKPSSPTPHHLKEHKLSFLDQTVPSVYISLFSFYGAVQIHGLKETYCQLLKTSLSMALTHYYPLAGRVRDNYMINCNDAGALFIEAKVDTDLLQVIKNPDMDGLKLLLPLDPNGNRNSAEDAILAVQINRMHCGGTAIAVQLSHKVADAHSLFTFMNSWAAICRGCDDAEIKQPMFDFTSYFPPLDSSMNLEETISSKTKEKIVTKRIVFDKKNLEILKQTAASGNYNNVSQVHHPTRFEVVAGLIWKQFLGAKKCESGGKKVIAAVLPVNIRSRMNPPLPDHSFGNLCIGNIALNEEGDGYEGLVGEVKAAAKKINKTYVDRIRNVDEYMQTLMSIGEVETCVLSSWSRLPVYEVDYGWGKPVWVTTTNFPVKDIATIIDTKTGYGLEVLINMLEKDASFFESDFVLNLSP